MTWLFFVAFYLKADGLPLLGWAAFAGAVVWDLLKERRETKRAQDQAQDLSLRLARMEQLLEEIVRREKP